MHFPRCFFLVFLLLFFCIPFIQAAPPRFIPADEAREIILKKRRLQDDRLSVIWELIEDEKIEDAFSASTFNKEHALRLLEFPNVRVSRDTLGYQEEGRRVVYLIAAYNTAPSNDQASLESTFGYITGLQFERIDSK